MTTLSSSDRSDAAASLPRSASSISATSASGPWACGTCTFLNEDSLHLTCEVCGEPRAESNLSKYEQESNQAQEKWRAAGRPMPEQEEEDSIPLPSSSRAHASAAPDKGLAKHESASADKESLDNRVPGKMEEFTSTPPHRRPTKNTRQSNHRPEEEDGDSLKPPSRPPGNTSPLLDRESQSNHRSEEKDDSQKPPSPPTTDTSNTSPLSDRASLHRPEEQPSSIPGTSLGQENTQSLQNQLNSRIRAKMEVGTGSRSYNDESTGRAMNKQADVDTGFLRPGAYSVKDQENLERQDTGFISPQAARNRTPSEGNSSQSDGSGDDQDLHTIYAEVVSDRDLEEEIRQRLLREQQEQNQVEEQVRQRILQEAVQAEVVTVQHGDAHTTASNASSSTGGHSENLRPSGIKEHLFGDSRTKHIDIAASPEAIRTRSLRPYSVYRNETTKMWIASVSINQRAKKNFSFTSRIEAERVGEQVAPPRMSPFAENPVCHICKAKFAVFRRPCHCRNCGVCVCSACATTWPAKMVPDTYNIKNEMSVNVCLACDWLSVSFRTALLGGEYDKVVDLYKTRNINLSRPFANVKGELMYPVHCAVLGGNLKLLKWLVDDRCCSMESTTRSRVGGKTKFGPILSSKGRSPLGIALTNERIDFIHYLVVAKGMSLFEERDLDVAVALKNFTSVLGLLPEDIAVSRASS